MYLKNIVLCDESNETKISVESLCITEMFQWELKKKIKTNNIEGVFIHCGNYKEISILREEQEEYSVLMPKKSLDLLLPFNKKEYNLASNEKKKELLTEALVRGVNFLIKNKQWDAEYIEGAFKSMYKKKFIHHFRPWKKTPSPNANYKAYPMLKFELDYFELEIVIEARGKIVLKKLIKTIDPDLDKLWYYMKELRWIKNDEVALYTRAHKETYMSVKI
ncbi:hypothetical protein [Shouchella lehensis]|uniref:Uncharacterized protein n=1 Tax=Shouchella lehensis G1 TaxID=1246626 RepID=A0A060LTH0_9BACI|nr:hypothetical protein [Shouchella lehensis]AIC93432.1 hypothetical protein BleG1_0824 [Shouchella lehensis G1]